MLEYIPYLYKIVLTRGQEVYHYIGSRSSKRLNANPQEFLEGRYNTSSTYVKEMLNSGEWEEERTILETFSGTKEGAIECCNKEGELLRSLDVKASTLYLNKTCIAPSPYLHSKEFSDKMSKSKQGVKRGNYTPWSQETKDKQSKRKSGRGTHTWRAFKIVGTSRSGEVKELVYDGDTPTRTCMLDIGSTMVIALKGGAKRRVKEVSKLALKHFSVGTILELVWLTKEKFPK
jgi:hypothetical protein